MAVPVIAAPADVIVPAGFENNGNINRFGSGDSTARDPHQLIKVICKPTLSNLLIFQNQCYFIPKFWGSIDILAHL
jgi:hypothetical protein